MSRRIRRSQGRQGNLGDPALAERFDQLVKLAMAQRRTSLSPVKLASISTDLDEIKQGLHTLAAIRRLLADLPLSQRQRQQIGLLATRLDEAPRHVHAKGAVDAVSHALGPALTRAMNFSLGRRRGSLDALDHVLVEILTPDPLISAKEVREGLKRRVGDGTILKVDRGLLRRVPGSGAKRNVGPLVIWRHPETRRENRTALSSIYARRLPRLRALVRSSPVSTR